MSNQYMEYQYTESCSSVSGPLAKSVENEVTGYLQALDDQNISGLYGLVLSQVEAPLIECVLRFTGYNQSQTAAILGLNRGTLRKKLKKYGML